MPKKPKPKTLEEIREEYDDTLTDFQTSLEELQKDFASLRSDVGCLESCETLDDWRDNLHEITGTLRSMQQDIMTLVLATEKAWQESGE